MIVYSLSCAKGHAFEGWFRDSAAFDDQAEAGKLACPMCNSRKVGKAMMAPSVRGSKAEAAPTAPDLRKMTQFMTGLRKYVTENAEYVGPRFAEEARKIHYGETDDRHIYGEATLKEAKELVEEGVDVAPLPPEPSDVN
ncbi:MAG TPA: DUF1178 family protein [Rhizomicrobium sp.]|nr:DUF1178 family protein [Rhizomicrobium sp.]